MSNDAIKYAESLGAEWAVNDNQVSNQTSKSDYKEDMALYLGKARWLNLTTEQREVMLKAFEEGAKQ